MLAIVATQLGLVRGFRAALDLNLSDETTYLRHGLGLARGDVGALDPAWSPPLSAIYAAVHSLPELGWLAADQVYVAIAVAAPLALWWALRAAVPPTAATAAALLVGGSAQLLATDRAIANTSTYALAFALLALGAGCAARGRLVGAGALALIAGLHRVELGAIFVLAGLVMVLQRARAGHFDRLGAVVTLAAAAAVQWVRSTESGAARQWLTFRQHFGLGAAERRGVWGDGQTGPSPFDQPEPWMAEAFPGATSMASAWRANPAAFAEHLGYGLAKLPAELGRLAEVVYFGPGVMAALAAVAALGLLTRRAPLTESCQAESPQAESSQPEASPSSPPPDAWRLNAFALATLVVLATAPLLRPRTDVLLPLVLPATLLLAHGWTGLARRWPPPTVAGPVALATISIAALAFAWSGASVHPDRPNREASHRAAVDLLREHAAPPDARILGPLAHFLLDNARLRDAVALDTSEPAFRTRHDDRPAVDVLTELAPDFVVLHPLLRQDADRFPGLLDELRSDRWQLVEYRAGVLLMRAANGADTRD